MGPWRAATKAQVGMFEVCLVIGTNLLALYPLCKSALHDLVIPYRMMCDLFCFSETGTASSDVSELLKSSESFIMETTDGSNNS